MVQLLDEYIPVVAGSEINDDPLEPISRFAQDLIQKEGDNTPIQWVHREERFFEKLATPDVTIADLIGDIDPIKAANLKLNYADERVLHFGMIPRANRCIFVINELPDLQAELFASRPRHRRRFLNNTIRIVARHAALHESQQHRLTEHQTTSGVEVFAHALSMNLQAFEKTAESVHHVMSEERRVRKNDSLDRTVRDVSLVPQRDVLKSGLKISAQHPRESTDGFGRDGIALVRHG